jgi:ubiquinone/menaquinone biosynthesis C-methylase UbiE
MDEKEVCGGISTERSIETAGCLQKEERRFWECLKKCGDEVDLKLARDLPDDTPEFILRMLTDFERDVSSFCFSGAGGLVLDAGCGNGNLLLRALSEGGTLQRAGKTRFIGMDFSRNMLSRAARRASGETRACFLQGSVTHLPFRDQCFDWVACSGVLTCLPSSQDAMWALHEFHRVLRPGGVLAVDFFNCRSHFTLIRKHLFREMINPPEYVSPSGFWKDLERAGFHILSSRGFDFKPCQGYLFMSRWRPIIDPCFVQERLSRFLESRITQERQHLSMLGYRIYVKCIRE